MVVAACGSSQVAVAPTSTPEATAIRAPARTPTAAAVEPPTPIPDPIATALATVTGQSFQTPTPGPWRPPGWIRSTPVPVPEITPREFFELTNLDGGKLLGPIIEASSAVTGYSLTVTREDVFDISDDGPVQLNQETSIYARADSMLVRINRLSFDLGDQTDDFIESGPSPEVLEGLEILFDGTRVLSRNSNFELWIDMTDSTNFTNDFRVTVPVFENDGTVGQALSGLLYEQASALLDPREIIEIAEELEGSPWISFNDAGSSGTENVYTHVSEFEFLFADVRIRTEIEIEFIVDHQSGRIVRIRRHESGSQTGISEFRGPFELSSSTTSEVEIDYSTPDIKFPQPGDPSIETDLIKIAAFLELFE